MNFTTNIDNIHSVQWRLSLSEAYVFSWIYSLPSWAQRISHQEKDFYFGSRTKFILEMPLLTDKPDTVYRIYRDLQAKGLILYEKIGKCDYLHITDLGKEWNRITMSEINPSVGNKSEKNSEINPSSDSEINPTYKDINNMNDNIYQKESTPSLFQTPTQANLETLEQKKKEKSSAKKEKERKCINATCKNNALPNMGVCHDCNEKNKQRLQQRGFANKSFTIPATLQKSEKVVTLINQMNWGNKPSFSIETELVGVSKYEMAFVEHHLECAVNNGWKSLIFINQKTGENDTDKLHAQFCTRNGLKTKLEFNAKLFFELMQADRVAWGKLHKELLDAGYENILLNGKIVNMSKGGVPCDDGLPKTFDTDTFKKLRNENPQRANYYATTRRQNQE